MSRKPPSIKSVKKLFALSGNTCAFPDCSNKIVDDAGTVIGQICHIEAAESGGERFNVNQTDNQRNAFENLILLCANDHIKTNNIQTYTVAVLQEMKKNHEAKHVGKQYKATDSSIASSIVQYQTGYSQSNTNTGFGLQYNYQAETMIFAEKNEEAQELSIIDEIFKHVNEKIQEGVGKGYKPEPSINLQEKIKLNFKTESERSEVNDYCKNAYLKTDIINRRFKVLDPEDQKDIHAHILKEYNTFKRNKSNNIEVLTALFNEFVPAGKNSNSRYQSLSIAFVLFFFDDCTIFEKTENEKQSKLDLEQC